MKSSAQMGVIVGMAMGVGCVHWMLDGQPSGASPAVQFRQDVESGMLPALKEGEVRLSDLEGELGEGILWVDARRKERWEENGLPGAINVTTLSDEDLVTQLARYENELFGARRMVIYCDDLNCGLSHELAERLRRDFAGLVPD
ncbi:MAG: rhodanese-like domain-containing protein, partial [Verrucomicrobiales bacterium]